MIAASENSNATRIQIIAGPNKRKQKFARSVCKHMSQPGTASSTSQTSTGVQTSKHSEESRLTKGESSYLPGGPVFAKKQRRRDWWKKKAPKREKFPGISEDILQIIVKHMGIHGGVLSLIKLGMVNKWFRSVIWSSPEMWRPLLPVSMMAQFGGKDRVSVLLRHSANLHVPSGASGGLGQFHGTGRIFRPPNFKTKLIKVRDEAEQFTVARKAAILQNVPNCSMCGSARYITKVFWELNMKLCRYCCHNNLVSHAVLRENYFLTLTTPTNGYPTLLEAVKGKGYFFKLFTTAGERHFYTDNQIDFPGGPTSHIYFWKPHMQKIMDFAELSRLADVKKTAGVTIRAFLKRSYVRRVLAKNAGYAKHDKRPALFRLRKTMLHEPAKYLPHMTIQLKGMPNSVVDDWEDRIVTMSDSDDEK